MNHIPIAFLASLLLSSIAVVAQTVPVELPPVCNDEYAKFLVSQQVSESGSIPETDRRIKILIRAADLLWKFDQTIAREYFTEAFKVAGDRFREKGFEKEDLSDNTFRQLPDHRFEVIKAIAVRDGEWAKRLIDQLLKEYDKATGDRNSFNRTRELDDVIRIAIGALQVNPQLSWQLFRRAMQHPLDFHWMSAIPNVAAINPQFADQLYIELLTRYADESPRRLLLLSAYPFGSDSPIGVERSNYSVSIVGGISPSRDLQLRFIDTFLRRAISYANDPENVNATPEHDRLPEPVYILGALNDLEPLIIRDFPSMIQPFSEARALSNGLLTEQMRQDEAARKSRNEQVGWGFDRRLKQLEEAEANGKLTDYMIVSMLTWDADHRTEEQFAIIESWFEKIKEDSTRTQAFNYFWFLRSQFALKEKRFNDAERFARKVPELEHRAILLFEIAEVQLKGVNDRATAYTTLREVARIAEQAPDSPEKARVLFGLVNKYSSINSVFAIQQLSEAVDVLNRLEKPDILSSSITRMIKGKNFTFSAGFGLPGYNFETMFREVSGMSFELSLTNAKSVGDKYLRALAVFAIAKTCADIPKKKPVRKTASPPKTGS